MACPAFWLASLGSAGMPWSPSLANVINSALARLGDQGMPALPSEASQNAGQAISTQLPVDPHQSSHFVNPVGVQPMQAPPPSVLQTLSTLSGGTDLGSLVPLGGGHFYDPSTDTVVNPGMRANA